jgi:hypothetical protein
MLRGFSNIVRATGMSYAELLQEEALMASEELSQVPPGRAGELDERGLVVLVTGSRASNEQVFVNQSLDYLNAKFGICRLIHGCAGTKTTYNGVVRIFGVDLQAERWAEVNATPASGYPAPWRTLGRRAGPVRNQLMLTENPLIDLCVAFPGGSGTADMMRKAQDKGIPVWRPYQWVIEGQTRRRAVNRHIPL